MQARLVIFPAEDGLNVVVWGKWLRGSMRVRHFDTRTEMTEVLLALNLVTSRDVPALESATFEDSCPLFSADVDEDLLDEHGFDPA